MQTETDVKHTPTPWILREYANENFTIDTPHESTLLIHIRPNADGHVIGETKANATFIVKACNAYDSDQKKIKWLEENLAKVAKTIPILNALRDYIDKKNQPGLKDLEYWEKRLKQAIQQAGE